MHQVIDFRIEFEHREYSDFSCKYEIHEAQYTEYTTTAVMKSTDIVRRAKAVLKRMGGKFDQIEMFITKRRKDDYSHREAISGVKFVRRSAGDIEYSRLRNGSYGNEKFAKDNGWADSDIKKFFELIEEFTDEANREYIKVLRQCEPEPETV